MVTIKQGSKGPEVTRLAKLLGLSPRTVCDKEMSDAMCAYQKAWGLTADGVFGYKSWKHILIAERYSKNKSGKIVDSDYELFAWLLGCEAIMIKAFVSVESGGSGFLPSGRPRILFESYQFWKNLKAEGIDPNKYLPEYSDVITTKWIKNYKGGEGEWTRMEKARRYLRGQLINQLLGVCFRLWDSIILYVPNPLLLNLLRIWEKTNSHNLAWELNL